MYPGDIDPMLSISGSECIGDSLFKINTNYARLYKTSVSLFQELTAEYPFRNAVAVLTASNNTSINVNTLFSNQSAANLSVYSTVRSNSAANWSYQGTDLKALSSFWQNTYINFSSLSSQSTVYSTVQNNSAVNWSYQGSDLKALSGNWQNTYVNFAAQSPNNASVYSNTNSNSANIISLVTDVRNLSTNWQSTYTNFRSQSADNLYVVPLFTALFAAFTPQSAANLSVYSTVRSNSAFAWNYQGTDLKSLSANWQNAYTNVRSQSATDLSVYSTVRSNSAVFTLFALQSANNISVFSSFRPQSAANLSVYSTVNAASASNEQVYTIVSPNSARWIEAASTVYQLTGYIVKVPQLETNIIEVSASNLQVQNELGDLYSTFGTVSGTFSTQTMGPSSVRLTQNPLLTGYYTLPNGLIVQWGRVAGITTTNGTAYVKFPLMFPTAVLNITTTHVSENPTVDIVGSCSIEAGFTTEGFTLIQDTAGNSSAINEMWTALGL